MSALKESQAFAYYWMVDLMIIYIKQTIAKNLDINDIIKKIMVMSARWVQIS